MLVYYAELYNCKCNLQVPLPVTSNITSHKRKKWIKNESDYWQTLTYENLKSKYTPSRKLPQPRPTSVTRTREAQHNISSYFKILPLLYSDVSTTGSHCVLKECFARCILVHCRPDDVRLTTETCINEYNIRLPVTRILIKQLCLTVLSECNVKGLNVEFFKRVSYFCIYAWHSDRDG